MGIAVAAGTQEVPPGWEEWTSQAYTLASGESMPFHVDWDQIPVRRWLLLVEGDTRPSYLNLRRAHDGSLVYDQRDETRHLVEIPWGEGESLSCLLRAEQGGAFAVSLWGPPRDDYLRAYSYEVNRALEAIEADDLDRAQAHLLSALREDPDDAVAQTLLVGLDARGEGRGHRVVPPAEEPDPAALQRLEAVRAHAERLRGEGLYIAALDTLQQAIAPEVGAHGVALIYGDLAALFLDMENPMQAGAALRAAEALGLDAERATELRRRLEEATR
jgi:hypothetical protein